ncbi:MAG TPA: phosphoribosylanthranilate isomerase [Methanobacterium sp.]
MMKVKICGITREEDVKKCEANRADLIGFINIGRSKRFVELDKVLNLTSLMQDKSKAVLVMETDDIVEAQKAIEITGINLVQFHSLSFDYIKKFRQNNPKVKIIKAVGIPESMSDQKINEIEAYAEICDYLLFDFEVDGKSGGTGKQIPLNQAVKAAETALKYNKEIELLLAGGIDSHRIKTEGKTLEKVFDYVDINSGVEDQPGYKSEAKIREFMDVLKENS